jgi:Holliday junction resolvasome RuvABC endonuclease subunit
VTKILGIDMAFRNVGLVVAELDEGHALGFKPVHVECMRTKSEGKKRRFTYKAEEDMFACQQIGRKIESLIWEHEVAAVAAEIPTGSQSARAAKLLGLSTGIISTIAIYEKEVMFDWVFPNDWHKHLFNKTAVTKQEAIDWVDGNWSDFAWPTKNSKGDINEGLQEHLADAMGVLAYFQTGNTAKMLRSKK